MIENSQAELHQVFFKNQAGLLVCPKHGKTDCVQYSPGDDARTQLKKMRGHLDGIEKTCPFDCSMEADYDLIRMLTHILKKHSNASQDKLRDFLREHGVMFLLCGEQKLDKQVSHFMFLALHHNSVVYRVQDEVHVPELKLAFTKPLSASVLCACSSKCANTRCACRFYSLPCKVACHNGKSTKCENKDGKPQNGPFTQ